MSKLELLKCPFCGEWPKIYRAFSDFDSGCWWCHCPRYACNFPYTAMGDSKTNAIEAWNEDVKKYMESHNEQTHSEEKANTET